MQNTTRLQNMTWVNLLKNKCPKCAESLAENFFPATNSFVCDCGFNITEAKYKKIVSGLVRKDIEESNQHHYRPADENPDY
jgi:hypothetical protein